MDISELKGIGPKTKEYLNDLNIYTVNDVISYYPFRFNIIKKSDPKNLANNEDVVLVGKVENEPTLFRYAKNKNRMNFRFNTDFNIFNVVIFNRGFLQRGLNPSKTITVIGKYDKSKNTIIASDIKLFDIGDEENIEPIYHASSNISSKQIHKIIISTLKKVNSIDNVLPNDIINKYNLMPRSTAILEIHNPRNLKTLNPAINYLKYEEFFVFLKKINMIKLRNSKLNGINRKVSKNEVDNFINSLPFKLTEDQKKATEDIYNDLCSSKIMNRLLQGDVGSGKTVVSFVALFINYLSKNQGALMAPTDILARQHYNNIKKIFSNYDLNIELLTGKMSNSEKKEIKEKLSNGDIDIIIGTHALFSKDVEYKNLGLVITDEQHRFGVNQRSSLRKKGEKPDVLYMSATPIPRTFALTIYGDMDVTSIKTMPADRKEVKTFLKTEKEIKEVLNHIYEELKNKHQVYVVVPLIDETENSDMTNVFQIRDNFKKAFKDKVKIEVLHGKMSSLEKEEIMNAFYDNKIQILISTTVVEVGLDNKNATMMIVFDSDRFGLSTLHQLRGRVGRGNLKSYFYMICSEEKGRLKILTETTDGFLISEHDFKERGSGDLFGTRQSGELNFKLADIKRDIKLLKLVDSDVKEHLKML